MAGHRERKTAFAADKNAFASGTSAKGEVPGKKAGQRKAAAHQPRDADFEYASGQDGWAQEKTSGHNVHKLDKGETSGHDVHKLEQGETSGHNVHKLDKGETSGHNVHKLDKGETSGYNVHKLGNGRAWQDSPRSAAGKPAGETGQAEKASQKRRQQRKFQKENSFVPNEKNQSGMDCGKQKRKSSERPVVECV